jgi:ribonuclease HI
VPGEQTIERAKLYAAYVAILRVEEIRLRNAGPAANLRRVVIKSDHPPVIEGITHNVYKWRAKDFRTKPSRPRITNADLWEALDKAIDALNQKGVHIQFWLVDSVQTEWASFLAQCSLDGEDALSAMKQWPEDLEKDWVL